MRFGRVVSIISWKPIELGDKLKTLPDFQKVYGFKHQTQYRVSLRPQQAWCSSVSSHLFVETVLSKQDSTCLPSCNSSIFPFLFGCRPILNLCSFLASASKVEMSEAEAQLKKFRQKAQGAVGPAQPEGMQERKSPVLGAFRTRPLLASLALYLSVKEILVTSSMPVCKDFCFLL